jgi:hypothetical protein
MMRSPIALSLLAALALAPACSDTTGRSLPDASGAPDALDAPDAQGALGVSDALAEAALSLTEPAGPEAPVVEPTTPIAFSGDYRFDGQVVPLARLTVDVVNMLMQGSAERLARLKAGGATCQLVLSNTYRCKKMKGPEAVPASSLAALGAQDANLFVTFGAQTAPPVLVNDAPSLKEWQIFQAGTSSLGAFTGYRYLQLEGGLEKIVVPAATGTGSLEFVVRTSGNVAKHETKNVTENQWRFHQDMAFVLFER